MPATCGISTQRQRQRTSTRSRRSPPAFSGLVAIAGRPFVLDPVWVGAPITVRRCKFAPQCLCSPRHHAGLVGAQSGSRIVCCVGHRRKLRRDPRPHLSGSSCFARQPPSRLLFCSRGCSRGGCVRRAKSRAWRAQARHPQPAELGLATRCRRALFVPRARA